VCNGSLYCTVKLRHLAVVVVVVHDACRSGTVDDLWAMVVPDVRAHASSAAELGAALHFRATARHTTSCTCCSSWKLDCSSALQEADSLTSSTTIWCCSRTPRCCYWL